MSSRSYCLQGQISYECTRQRTQEMKSRYMILKGNIQDTLVCLLLIQCNMSRHIENYPPCSYCKMHMIENTDKKTREEYPTLTREFSRVRCFVINTLCKFPFTLNKCFSFSISRFFQFFTFSGNMQGPIASISNSMAFRINQTINQLVLSIQFYSTTFLVFEGISFCSAFILLGLFIADRRCMPARNAVGFVQRSVICGLSSLGPKSMVKARLLGPENAVAGCTDATAGDLVLVETSPMQRHRNTTNASNEYKQHK